FLYFEHKRRRLQFAEDHRQWLLHQWATVFWTDECYVTVGNKTNQVYITRKKGLEELFIDDCLATEDDSSVTLMIWAGFMGTHTSPVLIWDPMENVELTSTI